MDDALRVGERHRVAHREESPQALAKALRADVLIQPLPPYEPHDIEGAAVGQPARVVDRHDARMLERRQDPCLAFEPMGTVVMFEFRRQHLERDVAPQQAIRGAIDGTHATAAEQLMDCITIAGVRPVDDVAQAGDRGVTQ